jgi:hypothetical protein
MGHGERERARRLAPLLVVVAFATCARDGTARYGPERDDLAMEAIASRWVAADGTTVELCDDVARSDAWTPDSDGCVVEHVVRGGGRGVAHVEEHGGAGCGGCLFQNVAYAHGTLQVGAAGATLAVSGDVGLRDGYSDDPYALPYGVSLQCSAPERPCSFVGTLRHDGALAGDLRVGAVGSPEATATKLVLTRAGPAACEPLPE